jgi:hypothetical protein
MTTAAQERRGVFSGFTAVDLITVVVFAALFRILFMIYKVAGIVFPWNHPVWYFFVTITLSASLVVVKKVGATFLFTVAWLAINFFFQGEIPAYWICAATMPLIPELYFYVRSQRVGREQVFTSMSDQLIGVGALYTLMAYASNMLIFIFIMNIPFPRWMVWPVGALSLILGLVGAWLGTLAGKRLSGLVG